MFLFPCVGGKNVVKEVIVSFTKLNWACSCWNILKMCHSTTSKRQTNTLVHQVSGKVAIPGAGVLTLVLLNLHTTITGGWWGHCCHVKKRFWSILKVYFSMPVHTVLNFARHMLYQSQCSLKEMSLFSVALHEELVGHGVIKWLNVRESVLRT